MIFAHAAPDIYRAFACSGFTVWGQKAGTEGVISGRNMDFSAFGPALVDRQLVLVRHRTGKHAVATIGWAGYIGAGTGWNDAGVATFLHDGNGPPAKRAEGQYTPLSLALTELLEDSGAKDAHPTFTKLAGSLRTPFNYLVRIVTPRSPAGPPERVFRLDANGLSENLGQADYCVTTNHYLLTGAAPVRAPSLSSVTRYAALDREVRQPGFSAAPWKALRAVAVSDPESALTLHSVMFFAESRRVELALATWTASPVPAPLTTPVSISFDQLFRRLP